MDKPARLVIAAVETRPEQPEAPSFLVLDPVIVADLVPAFAKTGAGRCRLPPFIGNPLRPVGPRHPVPAPPPGEPKRRVVRQQPECLDRLRRLKQPDRPRRLAPTPTLPRGHGGGRDPRSRRVGAGADRYSDRGPLRDVTLVRFEPRQCGEPQLVAE